MKNCKEIAEKLQAFLDERCILLKAQVTVENEDILVWPNGTSPDTFFWTEELHLFTSYHKLSYFISVRMIDEKPAIFANVF